MANRIEIPIRHSHSRNIFCKCFSDHPRMMHTLGIDKRVELMLGIGEANETLKANIHHDESFEYGTTIREPIKIINL